jgi:hypothetical protein
MTENKANREYKNSVFVALCEDKKRLIEIYNVVSNKNYPPDAALKIVTLENVLFLGRYNDVARKPKVSKPPFWDFRNGLFLISYSFG